MNNETPVNIDLAALMQKPWFEKYRPETIEEVVFENEITESKIRQFISQGYVEGNILSYGPGGTGKTTVNKVLAWAIIKNQADIHVLGKGVKDIEKLKDWITQKAHSSVQKIVIAEEFDRVTREAQIMLKDGLMEKYMPKVAFLCTTNNAHNIDPALLQRFNIKLNFNTFNVDGVYKRCLFILDQEKVQYNPEQVYTLVNLFKNKGIRDLINSLEFGTIKGVFDINNIGSNVTTTNMEDTIISWIKYMFLYVESKHTNLEEMYNIIIKPTTDTNIAPYWSEMIKQFEIDTSINYEYIFKTLLNDPDITLNLKRPISKYYDKIEFAKIKPVAMASCIFEVMAEIYTSVGGQRKLYHIDYLF